MMSTPFRGDKEGHFADDRNALQSLAQSLDFELKVIPDGIYSPSDAALAAEALKTWGPDYILVQASSFANGDFIRPFAKLGLRIGLWAVPEGDPSSEGGLPFNSFTGLNMYNSILRRYLTGYLHPVKWFFGRPEDALFKNRFAITVAALRAVINLQNARVGLIGGVAPGFDNLIVNPRVYERKLGVRVRSLELDVVLGRAREVKEGPELDAIMEAFLPPNVTLEADGRAHLMELAKLQVAFDELIEVQGFDAIALSCWPRFQVTPGVAVCSLVGQLNTLGKVTACEGDVPSAAGMLALQYLTNGEIITLMDLVSVDPADDSALLWHCGPTSPSLAGAGGVKMESLWLFDHPEKGKMGLHNDLVLRAGEVTVMGFTPNLDGLLVMNGEIDPEKPSYKGSRGWLKDIRINAKPVGVGEMVETIVRHGYQHHYPLVYGNLQAAANEMAAYLDIPVIKAEPYRDYLVR
jgi:L-fucose isomerase-like protein